MAEGKRKMGQYIWECLYSMGYTQDWLRETLNELAPDSVKSLEGDYSQQPLSKDMINRLCLGFGTDYIAWWLPLLEQVNIQHSIWVDPKGKPYGCMDFVRFAWGVAEPGTAESTLVSLSTSRATKEKSGGIVAPPLKSSTNAKDTKEMCKDPAEFSRSFNAAIKEYEREVGDARSLLVRRNGLRAARYEQFAAGADTPDAVELDFILSLDDFVMRTKRGREYSEQEIQSLCGLNCDGQLVSH